MLWYRLPNGKSWKETVGGMGEVLHDTGSFTGALCKENVQDGGERSTDDFCSCVHCPLEGLAVSSTEVPIPDSDAAGQHTLNCSPVECGEDRWSKTCSQRRKGSRCCAFLDSDVVLMVQVSSSVMCIPRNFVLLTLSTVELSMVSGGVVNRVSPEVHHNLLCLTHIEGPVVCTTPFNNLCHFPLCSAFHRCC